jgi:hypothetical protein
MPTECTPESFDFGTAEGRRIIAAFDAGRVTSDAGALLLGAADKAIRLVDRLAACFSDDRRADLVEHRLPPCVRVVVHPCTFVSIFQVGGIGR